MPRPASRLASRHPGPAARPARAPSPRTRVDTAAVRATSIDTAGPTPTLRVAVSPAVRAPEVSFGAESTGGYCTRAAVDPARRSAGPHATHVPLPRVAAVRADRFVVYATGATAAVAPDAAVVNFAALMGSATRLANGNALGMFGGFCHIARPRVAWGAPTTSGPDRG